MLLFVIIDKENLYKKIAEWKNLHKAVMNNYYGVDDDSFCEICETEHSLLIRKKEFHFYRLYVLTDDVNDLENSLKNLTGSEYAINIPSKTPIDNWDVLLRNSGFEFLDVYSRYYNNSIRTFPTEIDTFAEYDEIGDIASLLYANFSLYTDHLPSKKGVDNFFEVGTDDTLQKIVKRMCPECNVTSLLHTPAYEGKIKDYSIEQQ